MTLVNRTKALAERLELAKTPHSVLRARAARMIEVAAPPVADAATVDAEPAVERIAEPATINNRRAKRKPTALPAMITFENMRVTVPCTVADMSGTGAQIAFTAGTIAQFGDLEHLPKKFTLILRADRMQIASEVKWRRGGKIGVRFLGPPKPVETVRR